jgi:uncharacterized circularly permuted ATP-grasp superfamily protein/uncharacterized alpha-E superfamily protein
VSDPFTRNPTGLAPGGVVQEPSLFSDAAAFGYASNRASDPVFDEIVTGTGHLRAHWQALLARLAPLESKEMGERVEESNRLLRQNDVTYTIYGDPQNSERVWPLDVMPLLITAEEWRVLSAGVLQRAHFLNALIGDIYGPQRIITDGALPPVLLEGNPGFLRACHGLTPAGGVYLHLYAVDLGRGPNGQWWVLADRTETPSGAGYALENRSVIGRVLADCMDDTRIAPLAPFFTTLRNGLTALAPPNRVTKDAPRIVLLTPGPYNETYFEHLYLAGHLGVTLVQGADLTVRDRRVYIKTVSALEPVDIILRRVDDNFCDPLELYRDSALGVAGLVEAVRAGNVTVANALGSGVVQASAFKPFFPSLARQLLGEDLLLPDVASWWCGGEQEKEHVLANIDRLAVRPAFPSPNILRSANAEMSAAEIEKLVQSITANPKDFVAQARVPLSNAPVWENGKLEPRPVSLRVYVAAGPHGFVVMPGGLTRTSRAAGASVSMQSGGGSKDTWVLDDMLSRNRDVVSIQSQKQSTSPATFSNIVTLGEPVTRRVSLGALPSRVADSLFWTGRYAERTNGAVRLLRAIVSGLTDPARGWDLHDAEPLLNLAGYLQLMPWIEPAEYTIAQVIALVQKAVADPMHPRGIRKQLAQLVGAAGNVRDRLPADCWHALTNLGRPTHLSQPQLGGHRTSPVQLLLRLNEFVTLSASLAGAVEESMPRNDSWHFLQIGKRLERAIHLVTVLRGMSGVRRGKDGEPTTVDDQRQFRAMVVLIGTSVAPGAGVPDRKIVLDALLADTVDPRSLMYQLTNLHAHLAHLPQSVAQEESAAGLVAHAAERVAAAMTMAREGIAVACRPALQQKKRGRSIQAENISMRAAFSLLDTVLPEISDLLSRAYFTHAFARRA